METMTTFEVTIHNGDRAIIRPLRAGDLRPDDRDHPIDPRWRALRWLGELETEPGGFDCIAWFDHGRLFIPGDGQSGTQAYDPRGPQVEFVPATTDAEGRVVEDARLNAHWYDAATGKRAVTRTSAPLWSTRTSVLGPPNIELRPAPEE